MMGEKCYFPERYFSLYVEKQKGVKPSQMQTLELAAREKLFLNLEDWISQCQDRKSGMSQRKCPQKCWHTQIITCTLYQLRLHLSKGKVNCLMFRCFPITHVMQWSALNVEVKRCWPCHFRSAGIDNLYERALHIRKLLLTLPRSVLIVMRYLFAFLNQ